MSAPSAAIFGCSGARLSAWEGEFFHDADPWGFILFARNVETPAQMRALTAELREAVGRDAPILIDQEGGRVARMRPPCWRGWSPVLDDVKSGAPEVAIIAALRLRYRIIAAELRDVGVDVNCAPMLDALIPGAHDIIGDRALGADPARIAARGRAVCEGLLAGGVLPVIKHIPGHGRARADSHFTMPVIDAPLAELEAVDFPPFAALADMPLAMSAHVVYAAIDAARCATLSPQVVGGAIRGAIGFNGLLMTDDLSMHALEGDFGARTRDALAAGCDTILHCNGDPVEMAAIMAQTPRLCGVALKRVRAAEALRFAPDPIDDDAAAARYAALLAGDADV